MEHLEVNYETMVSAEVEMALAGKFSGSYRVIFRDLDADAIIEVRYFDRDRRADAIAHAKTLATGKVAA